MKNLEATVSALVQRRIRPDVRAMHAYVVQDATGMVKLDAMENPFTLPLVLQQELGARLGAVALNRYPGPRVDTLRQALAAYIELPAGFGLMLGNGSDELINLLSVACHTADAQAPAVVLAPEPGFVMYAMSAQLTGLAYVGVPLTADFALDVPAMCAAIAKHRPALVYLAYPNNPTANLWDADAVQAVVDAAAQTESLVVLDEAYQPFSSRTYLDVMRARPGDTAHVVLMRTLSKFGLAGVRLGYMVGQAALVNEIDKVRPPYNVSVLNCECALFALEHASVFAAQAQAICTERARLQAAFAQLPGLTTWPSDGNMILLRVAGDAARAGAVFEALKAHRVLIKNVSKMHPLLQGCLRVTVGSPEENDRLLSALKEVL